jgi:homoserine O-succinyltransferase/O-acetyltransferase
MNWFGQSTIAPQRSSSDRTLVIGLLNNTSDRALKSTERHFLGLLRAASPDVELRFRLFTCPEIPRAVSPQGVAGEYYAGLAELFDTRLDTLIVTGMEPQAKTLQDEPVWGSLAKLADWAEENAVPVIWSCLAAHAAVLHLDGIQRSRFSEKLSGIFDCEVVLDRHPLATGLPSRWGCPHSRYHGVAEEKLAAHGYEILSRSDEAGVDVFLKQKAAPFLFFQGHPEYEGRTLLLEYKRDLRRYMSGEKDEYPIAPENCFDRDTDTALATLRQDGLRAGRGPQMLESVLNLVDGAACTSSWRPAAVRLYENWLATVVRDGVRTCPLDGRLSAMTLARSGEGRGELVQ